MVNMRSKNELDTHISRVLSCGTKYHTIRQHVGNAEYVTLITRKCHSRFCPQCSKSRRAKLIEKMKYFSGRRGCVKMELTFDTSAPDPMEHPEYFSHSFDVFVKRLRRILPGVKYFRIVEIKEGKPPHFHIILDRFVSHEWVTENFPECGGGKINYEKWIDQHNVFGYITKYITKCCGGDQYLNEFFYLSGMRQVSCSRGIFFIVPKNHSFYLCCLHGSPDAEIALIQSKKDYREKLIPLSEIGGGPPDVFLVSYFEPKDLFTIPAILGKETRESLRMKRFDLESWQAKTSYPIFQ